jgi:ComF family protein
LKHAAAFVSRGAVWVWRSAIDFIYPPSCVGCGSATDEPHALCASCWRGMPLIARPYCERLGTPFALDYGGALLSPQAMADPPVFGRARAVARYDGLARDLVHRLKYGDRHDLALPMARWMSRAGSDVLEGSDFLVPVPLHAVRMWMRRANQSAVLAANIGSARGMPVAHQALLRVRRTKPQVGLSKAERGDNLQGAFAVSPDGLAQVSGRRIVLIDDVMTTGATVNACSRALMRAGAANVDVLVFARVALAP